MLIRSIFIFVFVFFFFHFACFLLSLVFSLRHSIVHPFCMQSWYWVFNVIAHWSKPIHFTFESEARTTRDNDNGDDDGDEQMATVYNWNPSLIKRKITIHFCRENFVARPNKMEIGWNSWAALKNGLKACRAHTTFLRFVFHLRLQNNAQTYIYQICMGIVSLHIPWKTENISISFNVCNSCW